MRYIIITLFLVFGSLNISGQIQQLANEYFNSGEFEKAAELYLEIHKKEKAKAKGRTRTSYFNRYIKSLLAIQEYDKAESELKKEIKSSPRNIELYVTYGSLKERQSKPDEANALYRKALDNLQYSPGTIYDLANTFRGLAKDDLAIETYQIGEQLAKRPGQYANNIAELYARKGDIPKTVQYYLDVAARTKSSKNIINKFLRILGGDEDYAELQSQLYERMDGSETDVTYISILEWTFIHKKQYRKAFRQARSLDRKNEENGGRVYNVGVIAFNDDDYDTAMEAFEYIIETKGPNTSYYLDSKSNLLLSKRRKLTATYTFEKSDFDTLSQEYESFLEEFGRNSQTAELMSDYAELKALYLGDLPVAIDVLNEVIAYPNVTQTLKGRAKLKLADYMLMSGDVWESTLLYSQVDKSLKEAELGEQARFKNAMLSYYNGDFEWAQEQFSILKHATSRLISNDAIDMAVFILDNLGLDTTAVPMQMFSEADLLMFQNRYKEAFTKWDSIEILFPEHGLADDILFKKANIFVKQQKYQEAVSAYDTIITKFPEEIYADNALFNLAELYEGPLEDRVKAKDLYQQLILDFSGSTFAVIARERNAKLEDEVQ